MIIRLGTAALAAACVFVAAASPAAAQNYDQQLNQQMALADEQFGASGMTRVFGPEKGSLDKGDDASFYLNLQAGKTYTILGVCDTDCSDLDLTIFSPGNDELVKDVLTDDAPIVTITPTSTAQYRLQVDMFACSADPCFYAVGVWRK